MKIKGKISDNKLSIFCWNIANPSIIRAQRQALWLIKRPEDILILTEAKNSEGCDYLKNYFQSLRYSVVFSKPEGREFGVMIISRHRLSKSEFSKNVNFLRARVASAKIFFGGEEIEIIGTYVPSRDSSPGKIEKKKRFLKELTNALALSSNSSQRIFCGDFNILERDHFPHYSFFKDWEYDFYNKLKTNQFVDAFRFISPAGREYSWVGRTGDGYRYDHSFVSENLSRSIKNCFYSHEPREKKLSDHAAIITKLNFQTA